MIMKKWMFFVAGILLIALFPIITACSSDDDNTEQVNINENSPKDNDNYYVKYEVTNGTMMSYYYGEIKQIKYKDVNKENNIQIEVGEWDGTYGPFKKGDKVYLNVRSTGRHNSNARISVSKNKEAFAIKAEERESNDIRLNYIIDF